MRLARVLLVLSAGVSLCAAQPKKAPPAKPPAKAAVPTPPPKATAVADGVFLGRGGKPMAGAKVYLAEVAGDDEFPYTVVKLPERLPSATVDDKGRFQFKGFPAGRYTIVYQPAGTRGILPAQFSIKALNYVDKSIAPGLKGLELGKADPFDDRPWGKTFTFLKGHTMMTQGPDMKIWNATVRRNPSGPYLEIRRGQLWMQVMEEKTQFKMDAWSY